VPEHIRSDIGPEFVAKAVQDLTAAVGAKTAYIEPGSPWENGYVESFCTLAEARGVAESWLRFYNYNTLRPHGSLGYRPPAPEVFNPQSALAAALDRPASPTALAPRPPMH
jgi:transposase InsO family protein